MKHLKACIASVLLIVFASPVWADGHGHFGGHGEGHFEGHGHSRVFLDFGIGPWWGPGWYYPPPAYYYPPAVVVQPQPQVYIEQPQAAVPSPAPASSYWYYCAASKRYYPYVNECPSGWQRVSPTPPGQ